MSKIIRCAACLLVTNSYLVTMAASSVPTDPVTGATVPSNMEEITIIGTPEDAANSAGSAQVIDADHLVKFEYADVQRILRDVPGISVQLEDGYGLRPNLSIRGTATERSGRITLLEDNVLIAPAPYSAPSAYYFPTAGRLHQVEVLKGSSAIKQGPYTVGGAINLVSTPIPDIRSGVLNVEAGTDHTTRAHAWYGDNRLHYGWLVEGHLWDSDGFQTIDKTGGDTGLDKDDWTVKLRLNNTPAAPVYHQLDIKLQYASEDSEQSYLGLTDADFTANPMRRYAPSQLDNIETEHDQVIVRYLASVQNRFDFTAALYSNRHKRNWYKTEGLDVDGSTSAATFARTSWFSVVQAVNTGSGIGNLSASGLQAILDGGDTANGAIQLRANAREYFSRGVQLGLEWEQSIGAAVHEIELGIRYHEDEEDRLQRNSTYTQKNGVLELADMGLSGNAGNRIQEADALSFHIYDRVSIGNWAFTPGIRYEDIRQQRTRWEIRPANTVNPASRSDANLRSMRKNNTRVWLPGVGALYAVNEQLAFYGGVHKGFTAPSNAPDVDEEQSINYEVGLRYLTAGLSVDAAVFLTDYDNILGECTSSSGSDCEVGAAFNGDAASIAGLELQLNYNLSQSGYYSLPVSLSYSWLDGQFDSDIADTDFFGDVSRGDPLPYIPKNQLLLTLGWEQAGWSTYLNANYVDEVCVRASCGDFERTDKFLLLDISTAYQVSPRLSVYARVDNLSGEKAIVGRQPYGARPAKSRSYALGFRFSL
ncbi:MAG: TonB-dependent receptor [Gammaproteobacteria bacterium]|nr:TonB-dependent receptor [Gammaproteobacteria bacterium]